MTRPCKCGHGRTDHVHLRRGTPCCVCRDCVHFRDALSLRRRVAQWLSSRFAHSPADPAAKVRTFDGKW